MVLVDTSVLIAVERGRLTLATVLPDQESVAISAITFSELLHGVYRADSPSRRAARESYVERLAAALPILPIDQIVARVHARLNAELRKQGLVIGAHDLLIACTALAHGAKILTGDLRSFPHIPGLEVIAC